MLCSVLFLLIFVVVAIFFKFFMHHPRMDQEVLPQLHQKI